MVPTWFWATTAFLFGISIGSFLNVVIYRLPIGKSVVEPQWSFCPICAHRLHGMDLVPLFSYLLLGRRCRYCKQPISPRYFGVELLTGLLFVALYLNKAGSFPDALALICFTAVLIPIFFIDLATFTIPTSLNLLAFLIALARDLWGIAQHEPGHELLWGWLPVSVLGAIVGALIFGLVRIAGWLWKRVEAMGLGDVLLGRALGAMLVSVVPPDKNPLRLFPIWVLLSCLSGIVVGLPLIMLRRRQEMAAQKVNKVDSSLEIAGEEAEDGEQYSSLRREIEDVLYCLLLGDAFELAKERLKRKLFALGIEAENQRQEKVEAQQREIEEDWTPAATAIPFGPFLVVGFLAAVFIGEWLTAAYLAYALPRT